MSDAAPIVLKAVGDVCLHGIHSDPFVHVRHLLDADLLFGNLECCLTRGGDARDKPALFRADPAAAAYLVEHRFNLVCLANNHVLDYGGDGLRDTLHALKEHGLQYCGAGHTAAEAQREVDIVLRGRRTAILSTVDAAGTAGGGPAVSTLAARAMRRRIEAVRGKADLVIVSYHGGIELDTVPSPFVVRTLRGFVDAGADIVLGHHPHVLQAVERYNGGLIAYSLGNFVFDNSRYGDNAALAARTMILELSIDVDPSGAPVVSHRYLAAKTGEDFLPRPLAPGDELQFEQYMRELGQGLSAVSASGADVRRVEGLAGSVHSKSFGTIVRYAIRHIGDFSPREIALGIALIGKQALTRLFGRGRRSGNS